MKIASALACIVFLVAAPAAACMSDADCAMGSKCVKADRAVYGVCKGGTQPGNRNDRQPVYDPRDPNQTVGKTCQYDADCGPGSRCAKESGSFYGVCVR